MRNLLYIVGQLEHLGREAAAHYRALCQIEGDDPLQDPYCQSVLENLLEERRRSLRESWDAGR